MGPSKRSKPASGAEAPAKRRRKQPKQAAKPESGDSSSDSGSEGEEELTAADLQGLKAFMKKQLVKAATSSSKKGGKKQRRTAAEALAEVDRAMAAMGSDDDDDESGEEEEEEAKPRGKRLSGARRGENNGAVEGRGIVYVGHVPFGFFEDQMKDFFSQFGEVTRLRLARSKRTGNSKHFAFVEFDEEDTAAVVADAMDGYMMFGRALQCHVVEQDRVHPQLFRNAGRRFRRVPWARIARDRHNRDRSDDEKAARRQKLLKAEAKRRQKLAALGISYSYRGYAEEAGAAAADDKPKKKAKKSKKEAVATPTAAAKKGKKRAAAEAETATPAKKAKKAKKARK